MRLATVRHRGAEHGVAVHPQRGLVLLADLEGVPGDVLGVIAADALDAVRSAADRAPDSAFRDPADERFGAPYRRPRKIWGIGLNYIEHAADLTESTPDEPASFLKGDHTIIGPDEPIPVPPQSRRTTAEAELGLVIGRYCRNVEPEEALDHLAGVVPVLDQTAEDILQRNPRFLTRAKNFPGFFAFGPCIVPLAEAVAPAGSLEDIEVSTVINGAVHRSNRVSRMRFDPAFLVSFHSKVMPLFPGDIISPGTPGAVHVRPGDVVECRVPGVGILRNPVIAGE
jgi:2-keto-4-pentenoate hydratase/2-oxohepta-3-ene-1,7-dioic acid hydratase in catechol pathway